MQTQKEMELKYSAVFSTDIFVNDIADNFEKYLGESEKFIIEYLNDCETNPEEHLYYSLKDGTIKYNEALEESLITIKEMELEKLLIELMAFNWLNESCTIQQMVGFIESRITKEMEYTTRRFKVAEVILAGYIQSPYVEYCENFKETAMFYCDLDITQRHADDHDKRMYTLPLIEPPLKVTNNYSCGYHVISKGLLLGNKFARHNENLRYSHINKMNSVAYEMELRLFDMTAPIFKDKPKMKDNGYYETEQEVEERRAQFDQIVHNIPIAVDALAGRLFYHVHAYDSRGRFYPKAHEFNYQGTKFFRAMQQFANKEIIAPDWYAEEEEYTPAQWVLIDLASQYGYDKKSYEFRLEFGQKVLELIKSGEDLRGLEDEISSGNGDKAGGEPANFYLRVLTIMDILDGVPCGHPLGLDAASSGPQLLSVMMRCRIGMHNTGVLGADIPDLYTTVLIEILKLTNDDITRQMVKDALIPWIYGSTSSGLVVFRDADLADKFAEATQEAIPDAALIREVLLNCWDKKAEYYTWKLPDGHTAYTPVTDSFLYEGCKFVGKKYNYIRTEQRPCDFGAALPANITHSFDAYIGRELCERANYDQQALMLTLNSIENHRKYGGSPKHASEAVMELVELAEKYQMVSIELALRIRNEELEGIPSWILDALEALIVKIIQVPPFEVRMIHDEFQCHPNYINRMKSIYNDLLVEAYAGDWLFATIEDLSGECFRKYRNEYIAEDVKAIKNNLYAIN